jgi:ABC-2 type transport system ATP-binding protein
MTSPAADISVYQLSKYYGTLLAVDSISFDVPKGAIVGFLGPNGSGKSTTLRMLTCFMPPTSGSAKVVGLDVFTQSLEVRTKIGYLPESNPLYPDMRIHEYLDFKGRLHGMDRATRKSRIGAVMERCFLTERKNSLIATLSKGYRQRVGIADALLHNPPVVVLDEPTVGLDPTQTREARNLIKSLAGTHTVLFSTHIMSEVEAVCQSIIIIARGKIVAQGTTEELRNRASAGILAEVRGPADQVRSALNALPGVTGVDTLTAGDVGTFLVRGKLTPELRDLIAHTVSQRQWALRQLRTEGASLEEFFVRITDPTKSVAA